MNGISERQNEPAQLARLAAQRRQYSLAKKIIGTQLILVGIVGVLVAILGLAIPQLKVYIACWGLTVLITDAFWLTPWQKKMRETAAKIQEQFDCYVLAIPWNELKAGSKSDAEFVHEQSLKYLDSATKMPTLVNWYPVIVDELPLAWSRFICQRTNCWWDAKLRRRYTIFIAFFLGGLAVVALWLALMMGLTFEDFVVRVVLPLAPTYLLGIRHINEHREAAERLDKLKLHAEKMWAAGLQGESDSKMKTASRALQDEIFDGRKRNPPIFDLLFKRLRNSQEDQMNYGAADLVEQARKKIDAAGQNARLN